MKYYINPIEFKSIKEMPAENRPRERLSTGGPFCLSDLELVCCLIGSGVKQRPVQDIAMDVLEVISRNIDRENLNNELSYVDCLGPAKASIIVAALELGRRMSFTKTRRYSRPDEIFNIIRHYGDRSQEHLICIQLNGALEIIATDVVTVGLVNRTQVHPREVFAPALKNRATAVILAHNHPSMNLDFSEEDLSITQTLIRAGKILGISVVDHIVFSIDSYHSMAEEGKIYFT